MNSVISRILARVRPLLRSTRTKSIALWTRYRGLKRWQQIGIAVIVLVLLGTLFSFVRGGAPASSSDTTRFVSLASVGELSGTGSGVGIIGTVRSISEANILAQAGGTVTRVHATIGGYAPAGSIIAELENAAERASVLQAEGAYDAAVAAKSMQSLSDTEESARDAYRNAYTALDTTMQNDVNAFFGVPTSIGPELLLSVDYSTRDRLSRERRALNVEMEAFEQAVASAGARDPHTLLSEVEALTRRVQTFVNNLAEAANRRDSKATPAQIGALASARGSINGILSSITQTRSGLRTGSVNATASADASIKQTLGMLRAAQANLERTIVRAPIGGQVNFLPIRVGDYVTPMQHVATVAQNGALEVVAFVSEGNRDLLAAGSSVSIEGDHEGVITSVAPALDPVTKRIEVRIAVAKGDKLVNGQSVAITLPNTPAATETVADAGPTLLPLAAVKLRANDRIIFTLDEDFRLVAMPVDVGDVRGDRIEILTPLSPNELIVRDARGLSEGERVRVSEPAA